MISEEEVHDLRTHGVAEFAMAFFPDPHWQAKSVGLQPEAAIAVVRQLCAQAGTCEESWAAVADARARRTACEYCILRNFNC